METLQILCVYILARLKTVGADVWLAMLAQGIWADWNGYNIPMHLYGS